MARTDKGLILAIRSKRHQARASKVEVVLIDRYKTRRKAKKEAKQAEEKARKIVQTHYETAQPAQTYRSFDDFF